MITHSKQSIGYRHSGMSVSLDLLFSAGMLHAGPSQLQSLSQKNNILN